MDDNKINREIADSIKDAYLPLFKDIPDIGLYLNQVAKYINEYLSSFGNLNITESMISNYVKQDIIDGPEKKMYYRDQIAYLFFIAIAKSILSLDNIRYLIEEQKKRESLEEAYNNFSEKFLSSLNNVFGLDGNLPEGHENLLDKIIVNITHKIYIDCWFDSLTESNLEDDE